jgi:hypothetical protein
MAILMGFIGMLRISNVALDSIKQFHLNKHLTRGDVQICQEGIKVQLRWSKTMQTYMQGAMVTLPYIKTSNICPMATLTALNCQFPIHPNQPFLAYKVQHSLKILTSAKLQNMLNLASKKLNLQHNITFHTLRRSAASLAFQSGVPLEQIKLRLRVVGLRRPYGHTLIVLPKQLCFQSFLHNKPTIQLLLRPWALGANLKIKNIM